jgi:hypothetical protein
MAGISFRPFFVNKFLKQVFSRHAQQRENRMRRFLLTAAIVTAAVSMSAVFAADMEIPKLSAPKEVSVHNGPPKCSQWTDDCVNCSRGAAGAPPVCSNIGFACQPKAVRCVQP